MSAEILEIPQVVVAPSLEWVNFRDEHLGRIDPYSLGNIELAFNIAKKAHSLQPPRDTGEPFFSHPVMTTIYLIQAGCLHPAHLIAGLLHDVQEDNPAYVELNEENISQGYLKSIQDSGGLGEFYEVPLFWRLFGISTGRIIDAVTKPQANKPTRREKDKSERMYRLQLRDGPPGGWIVKAADRLHNIRTLPESDVERARRKVIETRDGYMPIFELGAKYYPTEGGNLYRHIAFEIDTLSRKLAMNPNG